MSFSVAVAGKGGTGKTTIASLIINRILKKNLGPVLAIDADPDANLGTLLNIHPKQTLGDLREEVLKEIKDFPAGMSKASYVEAGLHQIIEESDQIDLITMGRSEGPGCYCYLNSLIRKFYNDLSPSYPWIVIDNEAGLEHISRMTTSNIDALITVVNSNPLSYNCAKSIDELTSELKNKILNKYIVINCVNKDFKEKIQEKIKNLNYEFLCDIPYDKKLDEIIFNGESTIKLEDSPIIECIDLIINKIGGVNVNT